MPPSRNIWRNDCISATSVLFMNIVGYIIWEFLTNSFIQNSYLIAANWQQPLRKYFILSVSVMPPHLMNL